jgi:hypothetical protein
VAAPLPLTGPGHRESRRLAIRLQRVGVDSVSKKKPFFSSTLTPLKSSA